MNTDDLIAKMSAVPAVSPLDPARMAMGIGLSIVIPLAVFFGLCGMRPDIAVAWTNPVVPFKTILPLIIFALSGGLLLRLARPEASPGWMPLIYAVPCGIGFAMWIGSFVQRAPDNRFAEVSPFSLAECVGLITLLSIVPTIAALRIMRQGASTSPALSALLAGLTAASGATTGYSLFCTQDNPLFFITWYGSAILIVTLIARHFGRRMLSW